MSFTKDIKNEISISKRAKTEFIAEISAFVLNNNIDGDNFIISTENINVAKRYHMLIKEIYNVIPKITIRRKYNFNKNNFYILEYINKRDILLDLGIYNKNIPDDYIIDNVEEKRAYIAGCFMACGSVNDPKTSRYHLEFLIKNKDNAYFFCKLLNSFDLNCKVISRTKHYMVYAKESERIADFLRIIKAYNSVMYFEDIRIYRDHVNMTNRLNNCEQANVEKTINTANKQLKYIKVIEEKDAVNLLDDKTIEVIQYRKKYPESSLVELAQIMSLETDNKITKSGLNHKFRKIKELAIKLDGRCKDV